MKITDITRLAIKNIIGHKRIMLRVAVSVLTVVVLCSSAVVFMSAVTDKLSDMQCKNIDQACATVFVNADTEKQATDNVNDVISKITTVSEVTACSASYDYNIYTKDELLRSVSVSEDNEDYLVKDMTLIYGDDMQKKAHIDMLRQDRKICAADTQYDIISDNQRISFEHNYPDSRIFLYGRNINGDDEAVISEEFLSDFGFSDEEAEKLIGERITLKRTDGDEIYLDGFTVCGIVSGTAAESVFNGGSIIITKNGAEKTELSYRDTTVNLYYDSFLKAIEAGEQAEKSGIHVSFGYDLAVYSRIDRVSGFVQKLLSVMLPLICISMLLSVCSALLLYYSDSAQRTAVMRALGLTTGSVYAIVLTETAIVVFFSGIVGLLLSTGVNALYNGLLHNYFGFSVSVISGAQFIAGALSSGFVFVFVLLTSFITTMKISAAPIERMLKSE